MHAITACAIRIANKQTCILQTVKNITDWSPDTHLDKQSKASMKQSAADLSLPYQREREINGN
jgi:cell division protein FtsL